MKNKAMLTVVFPMLILVIFGAYVASSQSILFSQNSPLNSRVESSKGLVLDISLSDNTIFPGDGIRLSITELNSADQTSNLTVANHWYMNGLALSDCKTGTSPIGLGVAEGYYTIANASQAAATLLDIFPLTLGCVSIASPAYFLFQPRSDVADWVWNSSYQFGTSNITMTFSVIAQSFCRGNSSDVGSGVNLPQTFTAFGGDEWGHLAILHFTVVP